jgi:hypothetical protein
MNSRNWSEIIARGKAARNVSICPLCEAGQHGHDIATAVFKCHCPCHPENQ